MAHLKKCVRIGDKVVFDLESIFLLLLIVGQQRDMELMPIFGYELCAIPPSLVDEYGCLRKGNKAPLVERLGVKLQLPDVVIVDAPQLMYHVIWPCGGTVESLNAGLAMCGPAEKILVFDRYDDVSEITRGSGELALAPQPSTCNNIAPYPLEMLSWRINTSAICPVFSAPAIWDLEFLSKVGMMAYNCMSRPRSPSSATYFKPPTTVDRLSEFSLTTVTYSSCWYSGPGVMAHRISWSFRWKSGTALFLT